MKLGVATERVDGATCVIALAGELDLYSCPEFKAELLRVVDEGTRNVVVDLASATFIDSTALGVLLRGVERLRARGGRLLVACDEPNIRKVFEVTGLDQIFTVSRTREEALAQVPSSSSSS